MPVSVKKKVIVKPVANAIEILRHLSLSQKPERSADIARSLFINTSTCFNILRTLVDQGVLEFNNTTKTYSVGLGLLKLVQSTLIDSQRIQTSKYVMSELAARYKVTITLWKKVANRIVLVGAEISPADLSIAMSEGQRLPALMGASGRILAPYLNMSDEELRLEFSQIRWVRPISYEEYWSQVEAARENGWAVDEGFFSNGIMTVAVPVYNPDNEVTFTLSAVMVRGTFEDEAFPLFIDALKESSAKIASCLF